ncbi:MAG: pyruvate dehydrogenase (acetyl-transferring), homodimeric type [Planctomycetota bacterium]|nr:pyruvate dehydrogenase (acetyl-transferring), homodimeric type [Planctomycetota bacterium]
MNDYIEATDPDPTETSEWLESLEAVVHVTGPERARYLLRRLMNRARRGGYLPDQLLTSDYINTIPPHREPAYPGDEALENRINDIIRWNAAVMVSRANKLFDGLGGHISTFASSAELYDVAFNHFFRGIDGKGSGDQVYIQGHASPGIYSRAFLEGRLSQEHLERFRRESDRTAEQWTGLSSYPHARLMPDFWTFPTVSMGLGPIFSIYQARFNRYLQARGIVDTSNSRVWAFVGDGETDEPETLGALSIAAREGLDNLTWVVNCNLQRLDGPVRGNGKIIQELETVFRGAGWNVIKVVWGREWDALIDRDTRGALVHRMNECVDGQYQRYRAEDGGFIRKHFFGATPELLDLVSHMEDEDIWAMKRGGHDVQKVYAAYKAAVEHKGRPTVILAKTVKGFALGEGFEATNVTHQMKKMDTDRLRALRDRLELPIDDDKIETAPFYHPGADSEEVQYTLARRKALGGFVPTRRTMYTVDLELPPADMYEEFFLGTKNPGGVSTTMAFVRVLTKLLKDKEIGRRVVPIIPDEARTFGMEPLFRQVGIYAAHGQLYEPVDSAQLLYYRESKDGQVLEEGITEAGSMSSFMAAGTSYSTHDQPMIPFYIFYSMFGFQRVGDLAWAFADARGRGFLIGATAGRTTLNGEGLQHEDGHSHVLATTYPHLLAYDPSFAFEIAVIIREGLRRMYGEGEDVFYYITVHNENYPQLPAPEHLTREELEAGVLEGLYPFARAETRQDKHVQLFGSGSIMMQVLAARDLLAEKFGVSADIWGATSYQLLRRRAVETERWNRLNPTETPRTAWVEDVLKDVEGPIVAASDFMKLVPDQISRWIPNTFVSLGTDGFGMSDTREALRRHFEVDAESIAAAALYALHQDGKVTAEEVAKAYVELDYDVEKLPPYVI